MASAFSVAVKPIDPVFAGNPWTNPSTSPLRGLFSRFSRATELRWPPVAVRAASARGRQTEACGARAARNRRSDPGTTSSKAWEAAWSRPPPPLTCLPCPSPARRSQTVCQPNRRARARAYVRSAASERALVPTQPQRPRVLLVRARPPARRSAGVRQRVSSSLSLQRRIARGHLVTRESPDPRLRSLTWRMKERSAPTFDGLSASRRRRRRLCGGRMSGASLARRRIDKYDRRPHSTTKCRSSARAVAPALAPRRSAIEVPSSATLIVDGLAGRRQVPVECGRDRRGRRRVAKE
jgi:hypothetical protein